MLKSYWILKWTPDRCHSELSRTGFTRSQIPSIMNKSTSVIAMLHVAILCNKSRFSSYMLWFYTWKVKGWWWYGIYRYLFTFGYLCTTSSTWYIFKMPKASNCLNIVHHIRFTCGFGVFILSWLYNLFAVIHLRVIYLLIFLGIVIFAPGLINNWSGATLGFPLLIWLNFKPNMDK